MLKCAPIITPDGIRDALDLARDCYDALPNTTAEGRKSFARATDYSRVMGGIMAGELKLFGIGDPTLRGVACTSQHGEHIMLLFVENGYRGRRLGTALIETVMENARDEHITRMTVNAEPDAVRFYEKFGFETTSAAQERDGIAFVEMAVEL